MFDTHCHLNFEVFDNNINGVIKSARENGVKSFLIPGVDVKSSKRAIEIAKVYSGVFAAVGVHPTNDLEMLDLEKVMQNVEEIIAESDRVVAIGETGLDYYKYKAPSPLQKKFFKSHIKLAAKYDIALIIHNRHAGQDVINIIDESWTPTLAQSIVFHCSEPEPFVLQYSLKRSAFIGFDGDVTYDTRKKEFAKKVPIELIVIETDSPFLTPEPIKSTKKFPNEPKNLVYVAQEIAKIKEVDVDTIVDITTKNAKKLFNL